MGYSLDILKDGSVVRKDYDSGAAAKAAATLELHDGASSVTLLLCGSPMWTRFSKKEG